MDSFNSQRQKLGLNIFIFLKILLDVQKSRSGRQNRAKTFFEANQKLDFCRGELNESFSNLDCEKVMLGLTPALAMVVELRGDLRKMWNFSFFP